MKHSNLMTRPLTIENEQLLWVRKAFGPGAELMNDRAFGWAFRTFDAAIWAHSDRSDRCLRTVIATSYARVLRRPIELAQYVSIKYTERLAEAGIEPSVGSVGDSYDNALAETINGLYKAEVIHRRGPWRSFEAVELATLEWVDWFNNRRLLEPIGNIPPAEAVERHYAMLEQSDMAA